MAASLFLWGQIKRVNMFNNEADNLRNLDHPDLCAHWRWRRREEEAAAVTAQATIIRQHAHIFFAEKKNRTAVAVAAPARLN